MELGFDHFANIALVVCKSSHKGQKRLGGEPYWTHPVSVEKSMGEMDFEGRIVALLHDVLEDTSTTVKQLVDLGFSSRIIWALGAITQSKSEDYDKYIELETGIEVGAVQLFECIQVTANFRRRISRRIETPHHVVAEKAG